MRICYLLPLFTVLLFLSCTADLETDELYYSSGHDDIKLELRGLDDPCDDISSTDPNCESYMINCHYGTTSVASDPNCHLLDGGSFPIPDDFCENKEARKKFFLTLDRYIVGAMMTVQPDCSADLELAFFTVSENGTMGKVYFLCCEEGGDDPCDGVDSSSENCEENILNCHFGTRIEDADPWCELELLSSNINIPENFCSDPEVQEHIFNVIDALVGYVIETNNVECDGVLSLAYLKANDSGSQFSIYLYCCNGPVDVDDEGF